MVNLKKISTKFAKKIAKMNEGRSGNGIYKRRNRRNYRVIMQLNIYKKILENNPNQLDTYKRGYAVRVKPGEYFDCKGNRNKSIPKDLKLGENSFIYFKNPGDYDKYGKFCKDFVEVVELSTVESQEKIQILNTTKKRSWLGEYCLYVTNKGHESLICGKKEKKNDDGRKERIEKLRNDLPSILEKYGGEDNFIIDKELPNQTGLGNYDFDYASLENQGYANDQMTYLAFKIPGLKELLVKDNELITMDEVNAFEEKIKKSCVDAGSLDFQKLSEIGVWHLAEKVPICPLCKETLKPEEFLETAEQAEGREEEDNTQSQTVLMHIDALSAGKFNHCIYNLGWGHKHCNTIQGDKTIQEAIEDLERILSAHKNSDHLGNYF